MKKNFFTLLLAGLLYFVQSTSVGAYSFPIQELGSCRDQKECHTYCEVPQNHAACWSYKVYGERVLGEETPETKVAQLGITFPILELNNCANIAECKAFCSQAQNHEACKQYAIKVGITNKENITAKAKEEFGCQNLTECKEFCSQPVNKNACEAFAKRFHLKAEVKDTLIEKAKETLGCTTKDQCKELCQKPENRVRCQSLSQKLDTEKVQKRKQLVERAKEKLGCTSFETCRTFCQDEANRDKCRNFGAAVRNEAADKTKERLGCTTPQECRKECDGNPEKCPNFPKKPFPSNLPDGKPIPSGMRSLENRGPGSAGQGPGSIFQGKTDLPRSSDSLNIKNELEVENEKPSLNSGSGSGNGSL